MAIASAVALFRKTAARAAIINIDKPTVGILRDCFRQFGIDSEAMHLTNASRFQREKIDACVVDLDEHAEEYLSAIRSSPSSRRAVVFGVCNTAAEAGPFSKFGINVLIERPVERQNVLRSVKATHLLIINEFRSYVRVPIVADVHATAGLAHITGNTMEVSAGGMSMRFKGKLSMNDDVQVGFDLPNAPGLKLRGQICWLRPLESAAGIRFELEQPARDAIKKWIERYLDRQ